MSLARNLRNAATILLLAAAASGQEIPSPVLAEMEPHVQRQLRDARRELDELLRDSAADAARLAAALGRMGQLYQAYDIVEPAAACYRRAAELAPDDHRWHYYLGLLHQRQGRREESMAALERVLTLAPDHAAARLRLADQERAGGNLDRSEALYRSLLDDDATRAAALAGLGQVATARGDHAAAAEHLERALEIQPSATRLHYLLAIAYRRLGEVDSARRQIALQGTADIAFPDPLLAELSSLASGAAVSLQRGYYAEASGFPREALADYRRAVEADPSNPEARRSLAGALAGSGDLAGAIAELRALLEIDPNPAGAHFALAEALAAGGEESEAILHYQAAVDNAPDFRAFRLALARALVRAGRLADSGSHLRRLIDADGHDLEARIDLGEVLLAAGDGDAASAHFRAVLEADASDGQRAAAHHGQARRLAAAGDVDAAIEQFRLAIDRAPGLRAAHLGLASLLGRTGRLAEAADAFRRLVELDPSNPGARLGEATALLLTGDAAAAVARLEEGVARLPDSDELVDTLARLLAAAPDDDLRDGPRALAFAEELFGRRPTMRQAETLAMALAETGRYSDAAALQERVVAETAKLEDPALHAGAQRRLAGYRRGEPYRLPGVD